MEEASEEARQGALQGDGRGCHRQTHLDRQEVPRIAGRQRTLRGNTYWMSQIVNRIICSTGKNNIAEKNYLQSGHVDPQFGSILHPQALYVLPLRHRAGVALHRHHQGGAQLHRRAGSVLGAARRQEDQVHAGFRSREKDSLQIKQVLQLCVSCVSCLHMNQ